VNEESTRQHTARNVEATPADPQPRPALKAHPDASPSDVTPADERAARKAQAAQDRAAQKAQAAQDRAARKAQAKDERVAQKAQARDAVAKRRLAPARLRAALNAQSKEAAAQERAAQKAQAKYEREKKASAAKLARMRAELDELRRSYHLSGAGKKLDLRQIDGFAELASEIVSAGRTGMNYDRLYTLWQAVRAAPEQPIIEIGTYRGGSARFIAETLQADGRTPVFYVCDTFAGHAQTDPAIDTFHHGVGKFEEVSAEATAQYLSGYPAVRLIVGDIVETSTLLTDESFGFVHLDVDVYPTTAFCLRFFAPRLAADAVMVIDDYGFLTCPGVKRAADDFIAEYPQFRLFHLLTGQAILSRTTLPQ
jgi:predicted O-methyltransferase YrrM